MLGDRFDGRAMKRLADDFTEIRARRDELQREHDGALSGAILDPSAAPAPGYPEAFLPGHADAELLRAIFDDPYKTAAHVEALGPVGVVVMNWSVGEVRLVGMGIELVHRFDPSWAGPDDYWTGTVDGHPIGRYGKLSTALSAAFSVREPYRR